MKSMSTKVTKALSIGSYVNCADNTGVKVFQIISVRGFKGKRRTKPQAGVGSLVICRVHQGTEKVRREKFKAVIVRQKKEYRRPDGTRVKFEDNAAVVCKDEKGNPKGTIFKGPIAKEAASRWPAISKMASSIV